MSDMFVYVFFMAVCIVTILGFIVAVIVTINKVVEFIKYCYVQIHIVIINRWFEKLLNKQIRA